MKKLLALMLILTVLLAGCGNATSESDVTGTVEAATEETASVDPTPADKAVTMGRLEGGTYINDYAGFACELDDTWSFYSAEELQELPESVKEAVAGTEVGDLLEDVSQFTDMMAENVDEMITVNVLYQKMSMQERLAFAVLSEDEILDNTLDMKDSMITAYAQAGMDVESIEKVTVTFLGKERTALKTIGTTQGIPFTIVQLFEYHLGQYNVTLSVNSYIEDKTLQTLELFYPVN